MRHQPSARQVFLSCALQYAAILVGTGWGWIAYSFYPLTFWPLTAVSALLLIAIGCVRSRARRPAFVLYASLLAYTLLVYVCDPFPFMDDGASVLRTAALVLPLLFWIRDASRRLEPLAVSGAMLFLISCVAAMMYNALSVMSGIGLWSGWVS